MIFNRHGESRDEHACPLNPWPSGRKASDARYYKSAKGKATRALYYSSVKGKEAIARYNSSAKGRAADARYRATRKDAQDGPTAV